MKSVPVEKWTKAREKMKSLARDYAGASYLVSEESHPESEEIEALEELLSFFYQALQEARIEAKEEEGKRIWKEVQEADKKSKCSQHGNISRCQVLEIAINKHQ